MSEIDWGGLKNLPVLSRCESNERVVPLLEMIGHLQKQLAAYAAGPWHYPPDKPPEPPHISDWKTYLILMEYECKPWPCTARYIGRGDWTVGDRVLCWAEIHEPKGESDE